jgi:hypothetical protein
MSVPNGPKLLSESTHRYERGADELPSEAVLAAVSEFTDRPVVTSWSDGQADHADALPPLYDYVDPEALDALVATGRDRDADCSVTFEYGECTVTVERWVVTVTADV